MFCVCWVCYIPSLISFHIPVPVTGFTSLALTTNMLANVLMNVNIWNFLKIRYTCRVFVSVGNKFGMFASHSPPVYEYCPIYFRKASPKFQRMLRMLLFAVNFRKHSQAIVTLVRHLEAFVTFVRHLQGVCNVRRFPSLVNVYHCCQ